MIFSDPDLILAEKAHRPYPYPGHSWFFYQEWKQVLFINWPVEPHLLETKIPKGLTLDLFDGKAYVSLVAFVIPKTRRRNWPTLPGLSDFMELHLRTYVTDGKQPGIHFLDVQVDKHQPALVNKYLFGLPYEKTNLQRIHNGYYLVNNKKNYNLDIEYSIKNAIMHKSAFELWFTERYCTYQRRLGRIRRYPIHHQAWPLKQAGIVHAKINFPVSGTVLTESNYDSVFYSQGVNVLEWWPEKV